MVCACSVLGPVLFLICIDDMPDVVNTVMKLIADDAKLLGKVNNENDSNSLHNDLMVILKWLLLSVPINASY